MKTRAGLFLMGFLTLGLICIIDMAFGLLNIADDLAVALGYIIIGTVVIFSPWFYHMIWTKFIHPSTPSKPSGEN
jgi:hypothetical protein